MSSEKTHDELLTSWKADISAFLIKQKKNDIQEKFFDSNWVEMSVEAVEMD